MEKKPRVLLDVDGVLADFLTPAMAVISEVQGKPYKASDIKSWEFIRDLPKAVQDGAYERFNSSGWCASLPVYPGAKKGVEMLQEIAEVIIVTSPMSGPHWQFERAQWLWKNFKIQRSKIISTSAKHVCTGDFLVDDNVSHIHEWEKHHPNGQGVLWEHPHSAGAHHRAVRHGNWDDLLWRVRTFSEKQDLK